MTTVQQLLQAKGHQIWSVSPNASALDALQCLTTNRIGALLVCEEERLVGIFTERDYLHKVAQPNRPAADTPVHSVMTDRVLYVQPDQSLNECMALMTDKHVRHLPVIHGNRVVGMVSMRDIIKEVIAEREFMIAQLENYITDRWT